AAFAEQTVDGAADAVRRDQGMGALHPADQVFQTGPDLGDLHLAPFAGEFGIDAAVDKDEAARKTLAGAGVGDGMLEHGDPVVFVWQRGAGLSPTPLLDR